MPFREAIVKARRITGDHGCLALERFRELLAEGRITEENLTAALDNPSTAEWSIGWGLPATGQRRALARRQGEAHDRPSTQRNRSVTR